MCRRSFGALRQTCPAVPASVRIALLTIGIIVVGAAGTKGGYPSPTDNGAGTVTDVDGNVYCTVTIGTQVWMAENLRVTCYRDGTAIPLVSDNDEWSGLTTGAYCLPADDALASDSTYGLLYNFHAVDDPRGLSPVGWRVPGAEEWRTLIDFLGGDGAAGGKMKETAAGLWKIVVRGTTNESGFCALPAGGRGRFGSAGDVGSYATWWSSTSHDSDYAWHWGLHPDKNSIRSNPGHKASGFSVRCVRERWRIAFYSARNGRDEIFLAEPDGSGLRCLTEGETGGLCPSLSPDGTRILFLRDRSGGGIYGMDVAGGEPVKWIDGPGTERHPAFSPDGTRIAFQSDRDGNFEIYIVEVGGSEWIRLTRDGAEDMRPTWSPDGRRLAFNSNRDGNWEIYRVDADGGNLRRLTSSAANELFPAWSPDGTRIAFRSGPPGVFQGDIHSMSPDGSDERQLTDADGVEEGAAWSPDGSRILFQSMRDGNFEIYSMDRDGGEWENVTNHPAHDYWATCAVIPVSAPSAP